MALRRVQVAGRPFALLSEDEQRLRLAETREIPPGEIEEEWHITRFSKLEQIFFALPEGHCLCAYFRNHSSGTQDHPDVLLRCEDLGDVQLLEFCQQMSERTGGQVTWLVGSLGGDSTIL